jgi:hypothetical protein
MVVYTLCLLMEITFMFNRIMVKMSIQKSCKFHSQWLYIPYVYHWKLHLYSIFP